MKSVREKIEKVKSAIRELEELSLSGEENVHECYSEIKHFDVESFLKESIDRVRDQAIEELRLRFIDEGKKSYKGRNFIYTIRGGATRYYFTNVPEVKKVKSELEKSEAYKKVKATEQKYKTAFLLAQKGQSIVDEETGEIVDPSNVNVVYSADSISLKPIQMMVDA